MFRREVVRVSATAGVVTVTGCPGSSSDPVFEADFEDGPGDWESDAAIGPEVDIEEFEWEFAVSGTEAASSDRSPRIWGEGRTTIVLPGAFTPSPSSPGRPTRQQ